mgnify:CR=1 FL=1
MTEYQWINVKTAASIARVSPGLVYTSVRNGALRSIRLGAGRSVRTTKQWVHEWLAASASGGPDGGSSQTVEHQSA